MEGAEVEANVKPNDIMLSHPTLDSTSHSSVSKSPERKLRKKKSFKKSAKPKRMKVHQKINTIHNLEAIIAGLDKVLEEGKYLFSYKFSKK